MAFTFYVDSMIRGYHEYMMIWSDPIVGEELCCEREPGNSSDPYAVAVKKQISGEDKIVGHVPRKISTICSIFIRRGGTIRCVINGRRRHSSDLPQGGLEIPCALHFMTVSGYEGKKAKNLIESTLCVEVSEVPLTVNAPTAVNPAEERNIEDVQEPGEMSPVIIPEDKAEEDVQSPQKKRAKCIDVERIVMGEELCDIEINFAQQLLKAQFTKLNGLASTLYQEKRVKLTESLIQNKVQIIYCKTRHHWIAASTVNCATGEVRVYDSIFQYCDKETEQTINNLFHNGTSKLTIKVAHCQKQKGGADCGLFTIAFTTAITFGVNPSKLRLKQESMRAHLINCFNKNHLSLFPCV